ncbi:MAG: sulfatase-like hydrolase/transferase [Pirellulaceae bacterium]|nr:sulfatase-like hydrolase/transferase [Planctomycetales bacterium]
MVPVIALDVIKCWWTTADYPRHVSQHISVWGWICLSCCWCGLPFAEPRNALQAAEQPNVIVVFIDDMGYSDLSCFGNTEATTPEIDRLASEGIRFTNFYVNSPICSPSRVALTTGQYPHRWRITSYLDNRQTNERRQVAQWLDPQAPVLARQLQSHGYATGHFGKWHMGGQRDVDDAPPISAYGFDQSLTNFEGMGPKLLPLTMQPGWKSRGRIWEGAIRLGGPAIWMQRSQITMGFVDSAIAFIDDAVRRRQPFFVNVWPDDVHSPFFPPVDKWKNEKRPKYLAVLEAMDGQFATLFSRIRDDDELSRNTLIILCSDNGPEHGAGSALPLRGAKTWLYEGGVRSPLIVWGPGMMAANSIGTTNSTSVFCAMDINRSLYAICGAPLPEETALDGEDLSGTLLGVGADSRNAPIFWRRPPDRPGYSHGFDEDNPDLAVRHGKWKYYTNFDGSLRQLYDLSTDVSEVSNVVDEHSDTSTRLHETVVAWNQTIPADAGNSSTAPR